MLNNPYFLRNEDFILNIAVVCPKCKAQAFVLGGQPYKNITEYEHEVQFLCKTCICKIKFANTPKFPVSTNSRGKSISSRLLMLNSPCDPYFGFDVWYRIETKYGLLWAYNLEHLTVIKNYIADKLRSRNGVPFQNNSIASRLPQWAKEAKNRDYLINIIQRSLK